MKKSVAFHTLGCKVNRYETDAVAQSFKDSGYIINEFSEFTDIYVINTCTVTGEADRKSRQMLRKVKKINPKAVVVAMGCHVESSNALSYADILIGNSDKSRAVELVENRLMDMESKTNVSTGEKFILKQIDLVSKFEEMGSVTSQEDTRAYIKIEDGCNNFCSYCIIPYVRGRVRSRSEDAIIKEAEILASKGFREIILTGIHVCSYGKERNTVPVSNVNEIKTNEIPLITLLTRLSRIEGLYRIRLGSLEPQSLTPSFIKKLSLIDKICPHFHISLQSGCDSVLERMNRRYTSEGYYETIEQIIRQIPNAMITTDIITGFPGETDNEHNQTLAFCRKINFMSIHVFKYSSRKGTAADSMDNKVNTNIIQQRSKEMFLLSQKMKENHLVATIGKEYNVLVETISNSEAFGYTENYIPSKILFKTTDIMSIPVVGEIFKVKTIDFDSEYIYTEII